MLHLRVIKGDCGDYNVSLPPTETMGSLRTEIWKKTGVPWISSIESARCQVLTHRGKPLLLSDEEAISASGLSDGDVIQLHENKTLLNDRKRNYLHVAAEEGVQPVVRMLVEGGRGSTDGAGAETDAKDDEGKTALSYASEYGQADVVCDLIGVGADCQTVDSRRMTPFQCILLIRDGEPTIRELQCAGADLNVVHSNGWGLLDSAAAIDNPGAAGMLIESGIEGRCRQLPPCHGSDIFDLLYSVGEGGGGESEV